MFKKDDVVNALILTGDDRQKYILIKGPAGASLTSQ
jgi:hypothetical protein